MLIIGVFLTLILFILLGMPVAFALAISGAIGLYIFGGFDTMITIVTSTTYRSVASDSLATIPLFILMAELVSQGGLGRDLFTATQRFLGRIPGGVAIA